MPDDLPVRTVANRSAAGLRTAGTALVDWWRGATLAGLASGVLWLIGLLLLHVPWAPLWALIAALMTLIPSLAVSWP